MAKVVCITGETHNCYKPLTILSSHPRVGLLLPEQFCWYTFTDSTWKHYWGTMLMFFKNEFSFGSGMVTLKISQMRELLNSLYYLFRTVQFSSVTQSCLTLCDPMNCSTPGLPVHHQFLEFTQTHVQWVSDAIQPSHPLSSPSSPALNPSQHQSLFQWVNSSHEVAKVLEFQL